MDLEEKVQGRKFASSIREDESQADVLVGDAGQSRRGPRGLDPKKSGYLVWRKRGDPDDVVNVASKEEEFRRWMQDEVSRAVKHEGAGQVHRHGAAHGGAAALDVPGFVPEVEDVVLEYGLKDVACGKT